MSRFVAVRLVLVLVATLGVAPRALAQSVAPPGISGIEEYQESIPSARGSRPSGATSASPSGADALRPSVRQNLEAFGDDGRAIATLVDQTAPRRTPSDGRRRTGPPLAADPRFAAPSVSATAADALTGSGGMGVVFAVLLLATALGGVGWALARHRAL